MPDYSDHYGFILLSSGESMSSDGYKFTRADRILMDRLLYLGAEGHQHTGESSSDEAPTTAPSLTVDLTQGSIPAGTRPYYEFTFISPDGIETTASPAAFIDTPPQVASPAAPAYVISTTGGTLPPGGYYYVFTAYTDSSNYETAAQNAVSVNVPPTTSTNRVTLTLPTLPGGADGFNLYRRTPSGQAYLHVATIDMTGGTPPTNVIDNGALVEDCDRFAPTSNTTVSTNSVLVAIPGVSPALPGAGWAWRIYRTYNTSDWSASMLTTVTDGSLDFLDTGGATAVGAPPSAGIAVGTPSRIQLTDSSEVQGRLPMARVSAFPQAVTFSFPGPLTPIEGTTTWVCPFPQATIVGIQATLGKGYAPDVDEVIVDVNRGRAGVWETVFDDLGDRAVISVGDQVGDSVAPTAITELVAGDMLTVDIDQSGGGAETDQDLTVVVNLYVYGWMSSTSHAWAAP